MIKRKILMVCEAFGGGVFAYVSQLCNDMCDEFDVYLAYALRPQTPKNYQWILCTTLKKVELCENFHKTPNLLNTQPNQRKDPTAFQ